MKKCLISVLLLCFIYPQFAFGYQVPGLFELQQKPSTIEADERVILFPCAAKSADSGKSWILPMHGWIFEPEKGDLFRRFLIRQLLRTTGAAPESPEAEIFRERMQWFLVDNESGKNIMVQLGNSYVTLPESSSNGHFYSTLKIPEGLSRRIRGAGFSADVRVVSGESTAGKGKIFFIPDKGVTVISDIDDTVKISNVRDKKELMKNTFLRDFKPVPGMAELYTGWKKKNVFFHFVSASPWQLYDGLARFMEENRFPDAVYHLKSVRFKDSSLLNLLSDPVEFKQSLIENIIADYPGHSYILVGDSGEKDPEVYGRIARKYPDKIKAVAIRDVTGECREAQRYQIAFKSVPAVQWVLFTDPGELKRFK